MTQAFDKDYWESHWRQAVGRGDEHEIGPSPYLEQEVLDLQPGTALDAGCGEGAEALWLAAAGWRVTGADISPQALARAAVRAAAAAAPNQVQWVEADLTTWDPGERFDLVTTHFAHPAMPQLAFYRRISDWVALGGTLLIVGHLGGQHGHGGSLGHGHGDHPEEASVTAADITADLDAAHWDVVTADERVRTLTDRSSGPVQLHDVVVRAVRTSRYDVVSGGGASRVHRSPRPVPRTAAPRGPART